MPSIPSFTVQQICDLLKGQLTGPGELVITGLCGIDQAAAGHLTLIGTGKFVKRWTTSKATAAIVSQEVGPDLRPGEGRAFIRVPDAELAMVTVLKMFAPPLPQAGMSDAVHPTAIVDPTAQVGKDVRIGARCIVGPRAIVGDRTTLYPNVMINDDVKIGSDCIIWHNVVIRERCTVGRFCQIHPGAVIGADGFGYRPAPDGRGLVKVPQIGTVEIGDDVEIGANTCIDRGKFGATVIGSGTKIDNLAQVGHNVNIGRCVIVVAQVGLAGSVTIGDGAMIGGQVGITDHVNVPAGTRIGAQSGVFADPAPGGQYMGCPAREARQFFRIHSLLGKLPELVKSLKAKDDSPST
ncbi:MAG: UDP-3-O-(3-hydroxymyristoyl)glucosamine N-acyltransferase [Phycisphaeraceae bacterium]